VWSARRRRLLRLRSILCDEMATYSLSKLLRAAIKFVADRVESFNTDIHRRDHRCKAKMASSGTETSPRSRSTIDRHRPLFDVPAHQRHRANQVVNLVAGHT